MMMQASPFDMVLSYAPLLNTDECNLIIDVLKQRCGPKLPTSQTYASIVSMPKQEEAVKEEEEKEEDDSELFSAHRICGNGNCTCVYTFQDDRDPANTGNFEHIYKEQLFLGLCDTDGFDKLRVWRGIKALLIGKKLDFVSIYVDENGYAIVTFKTHKTAVAAHALFSSRPKNFQTVNFRYSKNK